MEINTQDYKKRVRINFTQSTKDKITTEVTLERLDCSNLEALNEAVELLDMAIYKARERSKEEK